MGTTYQGLLDSLVAFRDQEFRSDPEREAARIDMLESTIQAMLEKLRGFDPDPNSR